AIPRFVPKACMSAVASPRRLVKRWSAPERSELACAGHPTDSMPCWPCVPRCSMRRTTSSGKNSHALLPKYLQLFHTPVKRVYEIRVGKGRQRGLIHNHLLTNKLFIHPKLPPH